MREMMNVKDAQLRLEQLMEGHLPPRETPVLANPMYVKAYDGFLKYGSTCDALREGSDGAGGFLVPDEFEEKIVTALKERNILRQLATVRTTRHPLKLTKAVGEGHAVWVPEEDAIPEQSSSFEQLQLGAYKLATMVRVTDEQLEDSAFDIEDFIAKAFGERLADAEEEAFLFGDGRGKPLGIAGQVETLVSTENEAEITADDLLELQHSIPKRYRDNGVYLMHDATAAMLRKLRSARGRNIWVEDFTRKTPDCLFGRPVITCASMPRAEHGKLAILFGDFSQYLIGDRGHRSVKRLTEVYARQGMVGYLVSQRVDGVLLERSAIAGLTVK